MESFAGTWTVSDKATAETLSFILNDILGIWFSFTSNGTVFSSVQSNGKTGSEFVLYYVSGSTNKTTVFQNNAWASDSYKTIVISTTMEPEESYEKLWVLLNFKNNSFGDDYLIQYQTLGAFSLAYNYMISQTTGAETEENLISELPYKIAKYTPPTPETPEVQGILVDVLNGKQAVIDEDDLAGLNTIFSNMYDSNTLLTSVTLPSSVTKLGDSCFFKCSNISKFDGSKSSITSIGMYAFGSCNSMTQAIFPSTLTKISQNALRSSGNNSFKFLGSTPPTLESSNAFVTTNGLRLIVPYSAVSTYKSATNWTAMASYIYGFVNGSSYSAGDALPTTSSDGATLTWYSNIACTTVVTTVSDTTIDYYCKFS